MSQGSGRERTRELEIISAISTALRAAADRRLLIATLLTQLQEHFHADGLAYAGFNGSTLSIEQRCGNWQHCELAALAGSLGSGDDSISMLAMQRVAGRRTIVLVIPLVLEGKCFGALLLQRDYAATYAELRVLGAIAQLATHAINRARLHEETMQLNQALQRREHLLHCILENMPAGLLVVDEQHCVVTANQVCLDMFGWSLAGMKGRALVDVLPGDMGTQQDLPQRIEEALQRNQRSEAYRFMCRCDPESPQFYNYRIVPIKNAAATASVLFVIENITEQQRLEAQLHHTATMDSLGIMAGSIAHELRNPLSIISASAQLLMGEEGLSYLARECAERIDDATQRADNIIGNLLHFTRMHDLQIEQCNLNRIIEESMSLVAHQFLIDKIMLELDLAPELPLLQGNAPMLQQVFVNLAVNACQAMQAGGSLRIATSRQRDNRILVVVSDTGCGIDPTRQMRIFEPFFTTHRTGEGTGLGLSISDRIIRQHQGQITVSSQPGVGTSFFISLPCEQAAPTIEPVIEEQAVDHW